MAKKGGMTTKDFQIGNPEDALTHWGDLSSSAMQGMDARNSAQKGEFASKQLQDAMKAIQNMDENQKKKLDEEREKKAAQQYSQTLNKQLQDIYSDWQYASNPQKVAQVKSLKDSLYMAGRMAGSVQPSAIKKSGASDYEIMPSGELKTEMADISARANMGLLTGLVPFESGVGAGFTGPSQTKSSNILPYGSYTINKDGQKIPVTMQLSPQQKAQREWEESAFHTGFGPLGGYGAYQKSLETTPSGEQIYR